MNLRITRRAIRQIRAARRWWLDNRDKAPDAFDEELAAAFDLIVSSPGIGKRIWTRTGPAHQITLQRIRYYLYYRVRVRDDVVTILALWHTSRRPPKL